MIEKEELERLVAENAKPLFRYCYYKLGGDMDLTEQTVSDVWLVVVKKAPTLRGGKDMRAYLYRTADNCIKYNLKESRKQRSMRAPIEEWYAATETAQGKDDEYFRDGRDADEVAKDVMESLPEDLREIFMMRFIEKKKFAEIVEATGMPYSNVRYRIELIRRHVRERMGSGSL